MKEERDNAKKRILNDIRELKSLTPTAETSELYDALRSFTPMLFILREEPQSELLDLLYEIRNELRLRRDVQRLIDACLDPEAN